MYAYYFFYFYFYISIPACFTLIYYYISSHAPQMYNTFTQILIVCVGRVITFISYFKRLKYKNYIFNLANTPVNSANETLPSIFVPNSIINAAISSSIGSMPKLSSTIFKPLDGILPVRC